MDISEIIHQRRAVRLYKKDIPDDSEITKMLEAARWAPSGLNNQPWRFLVIKDSLQKNGLVEFTKYSDTIKSAAALIVVCMDVTDSYNRDKDLMAIGACIQNMLLMGHSLGLATCWLGEILNRKEDAGKYLNLDKDLEFLAVIAVGYSAVDTQSLDALRKPLESLMLKNSDVFKEEF